MSCCPNFKERGKFRRHVLFFSSLHRVESSEEKRLVAKKVISCILSHREEGRNENLLITSWAQAAQLFPEMDL